MEIAIMLEGQMGLNWERFKRISQTVEELGFAGLYRSDHFTNPKPPNQDSLELWVSLTWLADNTRRIEFGPLVTPTSFRDPVFSARMGKDIDDLSGGRLTLGVGAGWQEREHTMFGYDLLDVRSRFARFEESLHVIRGLLRREETNFSGSFYNLKQAFLLPRPARPHGPPLLIGGNGEKRTLPLVAKFADEWNAVYLTPERFRQLNAHLDELLQAQDRSPDHVRRSLMTGLYFGARQADLERKLESVDRKVEDLRARGVIVGVGDQILEQLAAFDEAGVQRVMLQWLDLDDLDGLEAFAAVALA